MSGFLVSSELKPNMTKPWYYRKFDGDTLTSLHNFSLSDPYDLYKKNNRELYDALDVEKNRMNFPAITDDVGNLLAFFTEMNQPRKIFEFGSGYGHSAFWFLLGSENIEKIYLTERRADLEEVFQSIPWPSNWKNKIDYRVADAFQVFEELSDIDLILLDGQKTDYLKFLETYVDRLHSGTLIIIDNSFWKGTFLKDELVKTKDSAKKILELHEYLKESKQFRSIFMPYWDGVSLLRKI